MKSLFSVYSSTSVKKTILYRVAIIGLFMLMCGVALGLKLNQAEKQNISIKNYYTKVLNGEENFSQEKLSELNSENTGLTIFFWGSMVLLVISLFVIPAQIVNYFLNSLKILKEHLNHLSNGDLSKRITFIKNKDEFGEIYWDLNDTTDQFEALVKEFTTSIEYVTNRKYFRPVLAKGMHGSYALLLKTADSALKKYSDELIQEREKVEKKAEQLLLAMDKFAKGDLTEQLEVESNKDLMGKLFTGFNNSVNNINNMIKEVNEAVNSTISASTQIAAAIEEMAAASEEQSRQTSEITVAVDEMIKVVTETTQNTSAAAESSRNAGSLAEDGSQVVQKAVDAMGQIANIVSLASSKVVGLGKNSDKIGEIIQVINEIADQTNLLALNAAIEAARAGEHGRGFAVVADEVRKLAERTTSSTEEIASMIKQIQNDTAMVVQSINEGNKEVESGISLAESAGKAILDIVNTTNNVVDEINQVATASEEQSLTSEQIAQNIEAVNNVISETLLGIQQTASAAEDLNNMTLNLQELVKQFKIKKTDSFDYSNKHNVNKNKLNIETVN